jgi:hypothetical protein
MWSLLMFICLYLVRIARNQINERKEEVVIDDTAVAAIG